MYTPYRQPRVGPGPYSGPTAPGLDWALPRPENVVSGLPAETAPTRHAQVGEADAEVGKANAKIGEAGAKVGNADTKIGKGNIEVGEA